MDKINRLNLLRSVKINYKIEGLYKYSSNTILYSRDKYGLRGTLLKPDNIDILTVGGSTTDQRYIADGETWQDIIQDHFNKSGNGNIIIANAGVDGQSTFGHIKNFDWWFPYIPGLNPKYILFYVGINDFYKDKGAGYDDLVRNSNSMYHKFKEKSAIYYLIRTLYGIYQANIKQKIGILFKFHGNITCYDYLDLRARRREVKSTLLL